MRKTSAAVLLVLAASAAVVLSGCGKKLSDEAPLGAATGITTATSAAAPGAAETRALDADRTVFSCNQIKSAGLCSEWKNLSPTELVEAKGSCAEPGEVFSMTACPSHGLLATCEHKSEKIMMFTYKSEIVSNAADAKELCEDGVFTAMAAPAPAPKAAKKAR